MKRKSVEIGGVYVAKISGRMVPVKLLRESPYGGWDGRNEITGRDVWIKTAAKLRYPYRPAPKLSLYGGYGSGVHPSCR